VVWGPGVRNPRLPDWASQGSLLRELKNGGGLGRTSDSLLGFAQETWGDIPLLPSVSDDGDGLLVVFRQHTSERRVTIGLEGNAITDAELQHLRVSAILVNELETRNDSIVEVDQFIFGEFVDVDFHGSFVVAW
jgi:hypothetical protein